MASQGRIKGTEGKPIPKELIEQIVALKKAQDKRKKAKESEILAHDAAHQGALAAGYKVGDVVNLDDESPPLKFEIRSGKAKIRVMVQGREKRDEIADEA